MLAGGARRFRRRPAPPPVWTPSPVIAVAADGLYEICSVPGSRDRVLPDFKCLDLIGAFAETPDFQAFPAVPDNVHYQPRRQVVDFV
jgi:hypothetical protein